MAGERIGKCVNIGNCSLADKREPVAVPAGKDFVCSECGKSLIAPTNREVNSASRRTMVVIGCAALIALGAALFTMRGCSPPPPTPIVTDPGRNVDAPGPKTGDCLEAHQRVGVCKPQ